MISYKEADNWELASYLCVSVTFKRQISGTEKKLFILHYFSKLCTAVARWRILKAFCFILLQSQKMSHFPANSVTYDWLFFTWRIFQLANAHSAQRSLACVALRKMSPNFKWIRGFAQVVISLRAGRKTTKIHYNVFESSHNSQQKQPPEELGSSVFDLNVQPLNGFCDEKRRGQGRNRGQLLFYWSKANEKGKTMNDSSFYSL